MNILASILFEKWRFLGVEWAPLVVPRRRRLQTAAIAAFVCLLFFGALTSLFLFFLLLYSEYFWWVTCLYLIYMLLDLGCEERGSKRCEWVRNWRWWKYVGEYFPMTLHKTVDLDPSRNYLFACYPHGLISAGVLATFATNGLNFSELFPGMRALMITLKFHFLVPFYRELFLALGMCSSSEESIKYVLDPRSQGVCAALVVGGVSEILLSHPGSYKIILKNRKGFIRVALQSGSPIVPVFTFGEPDIYRQPPNASGSRLRRLQEWLKHHTFVAPTLPLGRGLFQYSFGPLPMRRKIAVVVGKPIEVVRTPAPSAAEIAAVHAEFTRSLTELFDTEKHKYIDNHQHVHLEIV